MSVIDSPALPGRALVVVREVPHWLENVAITFSVCVVQSVLVFGLRVDSWIHETANFLHHYETASVVGRVPVNLVAVILFSLNMVVVSIARRIPRVGHD